MEDEGWIEMAHDVLDNYAKRYCHLAPDEWYGPDAYREADRFVDAFQRGALPFVCAGHDGVPRRVSESGLKQLGNAVVPQVVEVIGRAIVEAHTHDQA